MDTTRRRPLARRAAPDGPERDEYKTHLRRGFGSAADTYDAVASLHREVARRLAARLGPVAPAAASVGRSRGYPRAGLDVGCGTGILTGCVAALGPDRIVGLDLSPAMCRKTAQNVPAAVTLAADAERLPFAAASFDLVCSSYMLQWAPDPARVLADWARVLRPGGLMALAVPVAGSLPELARAAGDVLGTHGRRILHPFPERRLIEHALGDCGVTPLLCRVETDAMVADTARALFRQMRQLGVQTAGRADWRVPPSVALELLAAYEARQTGGRVVASFLTLTLIGRIQKGKPDGQ